MQRNTIIITTLKLTHKSCELPPANLQRIYQQEGSKVSQFLPFDLNGVVVVPPAGLLWVLRAGLHVERIIRRPGLLFSRGKHGDDRETDSLDTEGRRPVVGQDGEADVTVAVDVLVDRDGLPYEGHFRRVERVFHPKLELQGELFALVERVGRPVQSDLPDPKVLRLSILEKLETFWGIKDKTSELLLKPLQGRSREWGRGGGGGGVRHHVSILNCYLQIHTQNMAMCIV